MNVALIGGVSSSYHALDALIRSGIEITGVLGLDETQAQRVSDYTSLRPLADRARLAFRPFINVNDPTVERFINRHTPDLLWVIGLSQLVPDRLIALARQGGVGFHPTMLPRGRGRAPVAWTILRGEPAAVTLFHLTREPDAGDLIAQREVEVRPDDYAEDLIRRTNETLSTVITELAPRIRDGNLPRTPQDPARVTYYAKRTPDDGLIDWTQSTDSIYRLVRAAGRPYPGAFTFDNGQKLTVWRARPVDGGRGAARRPRSTPGTVLEMERDGSVLVQTGDGALWLTEYVPAGQGPSVQESRTLAVGHQLRRSP